MTLPSESDLAWQALEMETNRRTNMNPIPTGAAQKTCPPCHGDCGQGRQCPAREAA